MKRKIFTLLMVMLCLVGITKAQSITLQPQGDGMFGKNCLIPVDVYVDTQGKKVSTLGISVQTDLLYVDFVPDTSLFSNFLPVSHIGDELKISSFAPILSGFVIGQGKIGTLYFKSNGSSSEHRVNLLVDETTQHSLLAYVDQIYKIDPQFVIVLESTDIEPCLVDEGITIEGGFENSTYDEIMQEFKDSLSSQYDEFQSLLFKQKVLKYLTYGVPSLIILCVLFLLSYKVFYKGKNS